MDEEIKEAQKQHSVQSQVDIPSNAAVAVPQNTEIISSFGNVESPSSLSLEFKLNIQFGQTKALNSPTSPPPVPLVEITSPPSPLAAAPNERTAPPLPPPEAPVERTEPVKPTEMSEVAVQAVEETQPSKLINEPQRSIN